MHASANARQAVLTPIGAQALAARNLELLAAIENTLDGLYADTKLLRAIEKSNRIMAEDIIRESGYMLPQSENSLRFLKSLLSGGMESLPAEAAEKLIRAIEAD